MIFLGPLAFSFHPTRFGRGRVFWARAALALGAFGIAGCAQGADEPCQIDSDCESGLVCFITQSNARGRCEDASRRSEQPTDNPDASLVEPPLDPDPPIAGEGG
jgi:hypothetical protein